MDISIVESKCKLIRAVLMNMRLLNPSRTYLVEGNQASISQEVFLRSFLPVSLLSRLPVRLSSMSIRTIIDEVFRNDLNFCTTLNQTKQYQAYLLGLV